MVLQKTLTAQLRNVISAYNQNRFLEVLSDGYALARDLPGSLPLLVALGSASLNLKRFEAAAGWYKRALAIAPDNVDVLNDLGIALGELGLKEDAMECFDQVLKLRPNHVLALNNRGQILRDIGSLNEAIESFCRAVALKPEFAEAHNNLGVVLAHLGRYDAATASFVRAVKIRPNYAEAHSNLGNALGRMGQHEAAFLSLDTALRLSPCYDRVRANKLYQCAAICDWAALEAEAAVMPGLGVSRQAVSPFNLLPLDDDAARHRLRAERYIRENFKQIDLGPINRPVSMPARLELGYFSADFHDHATLYLMARLFELHDRDRFRIHVFSFGPDSDDPIRARLKSSADVFHEVRSLSDAAIAMLARRSDIHIAVDLKGFTADSRTGIFAYRAAPLQVNYLGYPGTMGAPFLDYLVADHTTIPETQLSYYSEKIIYLPHSYQVNDNRRQISREVVNRRDVGLPEDGFVFCCFNQSYKISSAEFDIWMRLVKNVPGSVLWLLQTSEAAKRNLRNEASKRDVDPLRIIFAERRPMSSHLARHRVADLFLDTFHYNAHTAASDALWSGLPLVTKIGNSFASRVAASLLRACGLPELVTSTPEAYERLALDLAQNPERLGELKQKLSVERAKVPLFDSASTTKYIEEGFWKAYRYYFEGNPPRHIDVLAEDPSSREENGEKNE